jgi:transcriptional regulator
MATMSKTSKSDPGAAAKPLSLMRGTLDVLILKTVSWGPLHGYAVSRFIREQTEDALAVEEGALYPALRRMEKKGWLESYWGTTESGREAKFYELTDDGRRHLASEIQGWQRYVDAMSSVLLAKRPAFG